MTGEKSVTSRNRDSYTDILKSLGIISIVIGHTSWKTPYFRFPIGPFVYTYHLMIFLFVAGMCFKKEYSIQPYTYIGKKIKGLAPLYIGYSMVFILLHNVLKYFHMIPGAEKTYHLADYLTAFAESCLFKCPELLLSAFWFVPMLLFASIIYCFLHYFSRQFQNSKDILFLLVIVFGIIGLYANHINLKWSYHFQTAVLGIPVIYLGEMFAKYRHYIFTHIKPYMCLLCTIFILWILSLDIGIIELSINSILSPFLFYPITCVGIIFCLSLAKIIYQSKIASKWFSFIGRGSFHIMALHLFAVKMIDILYGTYRNVDNTIIEQFPHAFELTLIYYIAGVIIPLMIIFVAKKIYSTLKVFR